MPIQIIDDYTDKIRSTLARRKNDDTIRKTARKVSDLAQAGSVHRPVVFFNASTRIGGLSLNAAFSLISAWSLRLAGVPVIHFVCQKGMTKCVLGTEHDHIDRSMPCDKCLRQSNVEYDHANVCWYPYHEEEPLKGMLEGLSVDMMSRLSYQDVPVGELVLPALRWELRRHNLADDEATRGLYREFILSAWNVGREFQALIEQVKPQAVILFNGQFFPEAMARWLARQAGIRVITHEVGMVPFSAFFTDGEATAYPMEIPDSFQLDEQMNTQLDEYLAKRFKGNFKMAGIQFWQGMQPLDEVLLQKMAMFKQVVPVFTNVIFDTSQPHSNVLFPDMFTWMDEILEVMKAHPETLFVIRAHPDELRPGSTKQSRETVRDWVKNSGADQLANVHFVDATQYLSSYELIQRSKFVMVYNSSIGLEASIMGSTVLAAGRSRYTRYPTVYFPDSREAYMEQFKDFLQRDVVTAPAEFQQQSRRVLYFQLFRTAVPFADYLEESHKQGLVILKKFDPADLTPDKSKTVKVILDGVLRARPFLMED